MNTEGTERKPFFEVQPVVRALPVGLRRIKVVKALARLAGSPRQRVDFGAGRVFANVEDSNVAHYLLRRAYPDHGYWQFAQEMLFPGEVHLDVGANYGFHTFGLLRQEPGRSARHLCVEANPDCVACLRESARLYPECAISVFHGAAGETEGVTNLSFDRADTGSGRLAVGTGKTGVEVPRVRLDELLEREGVKEVGVMKMDIEGSERAALRGLGDYLTRQRIRVIYFEANARELRNQGASLKELFAELTSRGYRLYWPHADAGWIGRTCGRPGLAAGDLKRVRLIGRVPRVVAEFDAGMGEEGAFGQCDLVAVSPQCRVGEA
jgi:FkbM family methyltransferase